MVRRILFGLLLSALIGAFGYRRNSLAPSGVLGALIVGTGIFAFGGPGWGVILVAFFLSSSALSGFKASLKEKVSEKFSKGNRRDLGQVLANGGAGVVLAGLYAIQPLAVFFAAFLGAMATVNADTWATELGLLSLAPPRRVTTGRPVEPGTSGAVSLLGTGGALAGAAFIGLVAALVVAFERPGEGQALQWVLVAAVAGLGGSFVDSFLGATAQAIYRCEGCGKETERHPRHGCGSPTHLVRGWRWLDNDWVNFISSVAGAAIAAGLFCIRFFASR